mmetsp:Transcript_20408/g.59151  ORF Transcript_20408/g.59151 Transcript_20408/m.59151 type:complete len:331 (+) Transcript_20408:782-1774(+)
MDFCNTGGSTASRTCSEESRRRSSERFRPTRCAAGVIAGRNVKSLASWAFCSEIIFATRADNADGGAPINARCAASLCCTSCAYRRCNPCTRRRRLGSAGAAPAPSSSSAAASNCATLRRISMSAASSLVRGRRPPLDGADVRSSTGTPPPSQTPSPSTTGRGSGDCSEWPSSSAPPRATACKAAGVAMSAWVASWASSLDASPAPAAASLMAAWRGRGVVEEEGQQLELGVSQAGTKAGDGAVPRASRATCCHSSINSSWRVSCRAAHLDHSASAWPWAGTSSSAKLSSLQSSAKRSRSPSASVTLSRCLTRGGAQAAPLAAAMPDITK